MLKVWIGANAKINPAQRDRKSTRLNSSHGYISYAVFCLKKKNKGHHRSAIVNLRSEYQIWEKPPEAAPKSVNQRPTAQHRIHDRQQINQKMRVRRHHA